MKASRTYGFGVLGAGVIFGEHAAALAHSPERFRLVAVADLDEGRLRRASEEQMVPHLFTDHRRLLERPDVDVVCIATPPVTHERLIVDALEAGKAVLCEKPLAPSLAACDRILAAAERCGGTVGVIHQNRLTEAARRLAWLRDRDRLGAIRRAHFARMCRFSAAAARGTGWWGRWQVAGGGVVMTQAIHELDLALDLFGDAVEVEARMSTLEHDIESEDTFVAAVRFRGADGVAAVEAGFAATLAAERDELRIDVYGDRGSFHDPGGVRAPGSGGQRLERELEAAVPTPRPPSRALPARARRRLRRELGLDRPRRGRDNLHHRLFHRFADALDGVAENPVPAAAGRRTVELVTAVYAAALQGVPVALPLAPENPWYRGFSSDDYPPPSARRAAG